MDCEEEYRRLLNIRTIIQSWLDVHPGRSLPEWMSVNLVEAESAYHVCTEMKRRSNGQKKEVSESGRFW